MIVSDANLDVSKMSPCISMLFACAMLGIGGFVVLPTDTVTIADHGHMVGSPKGAEEDRGVFLPGNVILGGLFSIHQNSKHEDRSCGNRIDEYIQLLDAMLFAIDQINNDSTLLPGIHRE